MNQAVEKAKALSVYWPLDPCKTSSSPAYDQVAEALYRQMKGSPGVPKRGRYLRDLLDHIKVIVCNLHAASDAHPDIYIELELRNDAYQFKPGSIGFQFGSHNVQRVIHFMAEKGLIELWTGYHRTDGGKSHNSKVRTTPEFFSLVEGQFEANPATIYRDTSNLETVVLKGKKKTPTRRYWINGKRPEPRREVIKTPDRPEVRRMRANLALINKVLQDSTIDLDVDLDRLQELNERLSADPNKYKRPIDFTNKQLYRVFVDGSLELHGRFYGGWWESVPEQDRDLIVINGMPAVELDFSGLHPNILYGLEGVAPPEGDMYSLPGYGNDDDTRKLIKLFTLMTINAESPKKAMGALRKKYNSKRKGLVVDRPVFGERRAEKKPLKKPFQLSDKNLAPILEAIREKHSAIAHRLCSGFGNSLMYEDSQMAEEIMLHFASKGVACLPVHDSFIVGEGHVEECFETMRKVFIDRYGQEIKVDLKGMLARAERIINGPMNVQASQEWHERKIDLIGQFKADDPSNDHDFPEDPDDYQDDEDWVARDFDSGLE